jgi:DNA polymerase-4
MCPDLQCTLARHDVYVDYHHKILEEAIKHIPINKVWSIDEFSSRLPPMKRDVDVAIETAKRLKQGIQDNVGHMITCSIGLAPNSLLAKIATDMEKPDGLVVLRQEDLPGRLLDLALRDIPGIGVNMEKRLNRAGLFSMQDLWRTSPKQARKIWGSVQGERMWYWLHGYDFEAPETGKTSMVGHSRVLDIESRRPDLARQMARRLLFKATTRLRRKGYMAHVLSLGVRTTCGLKWRQEIRLNSPAQDPFTFLEHLETLWAHMMGQVTDVCGMCVRFKKLSTLLRELRPMDNVTYDLLEADTHHVLERRNALTSALDHLQTKYQAETVSLGIPPKTHSGHVGTKIAFSRVPDKEEFWS